MSAAANVAEQSENMTLWFNEKLSLKEEGKKNNNSNNNMSSTNKYIAPATTASPKMCPTSVNNNNKEFNEICKKVLAGQKVMIIMRGAPGSGKSTLAKSLLQQSRLLDQYTHQDFVFSSDDYFLTRRGYEFNPTLLPDAHEWNKRRVNQKAVSGWSPIIVDNTNMMIWEMLPYVQIAVQHGYILELLEPQTNWCKSAGKLAQRNTHQVPKESIQRMLDRYEKASVAMLLKLLKETKYTVPLPQLRLQPPLPALEPIQPECVNTNAQVDVQVDARESTNADGFKLNANAQNWVPYEQNAPNYWAQLIEPNIQTPATSAASQGKITLVDLLRDEQTSTAASASSVDATCEPLQRHSVNCPNEADGFVLLRQMYPNKQLPGLWDLYVKCNGDVDWAVDILLKEDELNGDAADYADEALLLQESEQFQCSCNRSNLRLETAAPSALSPPIGSKCSAKPQRQPRARRNVAASSGGSHLNKELQMHVENCFVLGDDQYSEHTRKIRDIRNGVLDQPALPVEPPPVVTADEDDDDSEDNALLEMELDVGLISQLRSNFQWEGEMLTNESKLSPTKVFVPRQLAKQLYMVYVEAEHNQLEEQRQQTLRDDEQFARLLKNPKYADYRESPDNVNELLDMELAWSIYNSEKQAASQALREKPNDIATHLTKMKLCEKFPDVPNDTVLEIFEATENNYIKTVEILGTDLKSELTVAELYEQALREKEKLNEEEKQEEQQQQPSGKLSSPRSTSIAKSQSPQLHEEAKSAALRDFEETRNLAAHHSQLRAECYLKAKQAIQQGNGSVALYYSEIAQLHKKKNDVFNHRAANCIMEVHKHTQNNPDLLDLHYLHTMEAVSCLDLFLDRHITVLRNCTRVYKHLYIITGRGLHSANGVSTIKKRVKARLAERRLRWLEVNPGLLRVKVFSASRHSKNF
ncbi:uncharacterized protein LOC117787295 isoform X2 [Drosophila innubila]|uniref:uncharacterized protein LOC117787295 isoform X2 n=1 Tax=Drosophila innubila TaxID=198719 RepID=UPI00148C7525|nr:uncharacterized protein LOC117787295 isoform X2 [Drosophila innubila]